LRRPASAFAWPCNCGLSQPRRSAADGNSSIICSRRFPRFNALQRSVLEPSFVTLVIESERVCRFCRNYSELRLSRN
jgi:hypothetical protein